MPHLPDGALDTILSFLGHRHLSVARAVCRRWRARSENAFMIYLTCVFSLKGETYERGLVAWHNYKAEAVQAMRVIFEDYASSGAQLLSGLPIAPRRRRPQAILDAYAARPFLLPIEGARGDPLRDLRALCWDIMDVLGVEPEGPRNVVLIDRVPGRIPHRKRDSSRFPMSALGWKKYDLLLALIVATRREASFRLHAGWVRELESARLGPARTGGRKRHRDRPEEVVEAIVEPGVFKVVNVVASARVPPISHERVFVDSSFFWTRAPKVCIAKTIFAPEVGKKVACMLFPNGSVVLAGCADPSAYVAFLERISSEMTRASDMGARRERRIRSAALLREILERPDQSPGKHALAGLPGLPGSPAEVGGEEDASEYLPREMNRYATSRKKKGNVWTRVVLDALQTLGLDAFPLEVSMENWIATIPHGELASRWRPLEDPRAERIEPTSQPDRWEAADPVDSAFKIVNVVATTSVPSSLLPAIPHLGATSDFAWFMRSTTGPHGFPATRIRFRGDGKRSCLLYPNGKTVFLGATDASAYEPLFKTLINALESV